MHRLIISCFFALIFIIPFSVSAYEGFEKNLHFSRLSLLKSKGFEPQVIYDIGAYQGDWSREIKTIFPNAKFVLFEANEIHRPSLAEISSLYFIAVLGDCDTITVFNSNGSTGDSLLLEQTKHYRGDNFEERTVQMTTLAAIVEKQDLPLPDCIKMDVQGAEKLIIEGGRQIIKNAEVIILETKILEYNLGAPFACEMIVLMNEMGYSLQDVLECHYLPSGELNEIDLLFIKKESKLIKKDLLVE